jgi:hypothetical protein
MYPPMRCALAKVTEVHHNAQANPCGSSLPTRRHCVKQLACICLWLVRVGVGLRRLTQGLLVCAQNLLPPKSSVLSSCVLRPGLLSARRTRVSASILRSALRWASLPAGGCSGLLPVWRSGIRATDSGLLPPGSPARLWYGRSRPAPGAPPVAKTPFNNRCVALLTPLVAKRHRKRVR